MTAEQALAVLAQHRGNAMVITTMGAVGIWPRLSDTPLDFAYMPSAMGEGPALALGLALAQPQRRVIAICGDGSLLMNLGCLVTIANYPAELYLVILDNGLYEVTGGQPIVGSRRIHFGLLAQGAGIRRTYHFTDLQSWEQSAGLCLEPPGPVVIWLEIEGRLGQKTPSPPRSMRDQIERLHRALAIGNV
ncbi:MAG: thiamine pyrophosphate-dependent enzyme [Gemmatales bacterium]|nr:thiamine pyrophosphate-dependent enzyme [Gemmatales bacterium]MDW8221710.1 thiamine pyrophosphate-dependent enzyme [Gemmatales bacterium]